MLSTNEICAEKHDACCRNDLNEVESDSTSVLIGTEMSLQSTGLHCDCKTFDRLNFDYDDRVVLGSGFGFGDDWDFGPVVDRDFGFGASQNFDPETVVVAPLPFAPSRGGRAQA